MARTIIDIPDPLLAQTDNLCKALGLSRAEAVRRALREFVVGNDSGGADGFGLWKGLIGNRRALLDKLRQNG
jgi:hypothetical protein